MSHDARGFLSYDALAFASAPRPDVGGASHPIDLAALVSSGRRGRGSCLCRKGNLTPDYPYEDNYLINLKFKRG